MSIPAEFEEAASRLRLALENNMLDTLQPCDFRVFIHETSFNKNVPCSVQHELSEDILAILSSDELSTNNQIVAATAYCKTVSRFIQGLEDILEFFVNKLQRKENQDWAIFLCHGYFQLDCWKRPSVWGEILLKQMFIIIQKYCCKLTSTCYFSFKVLHIFLIKIHEIYPNGTGISGETFKTVLDIVLSNWENPLNGVRQQNCLVLRQLLLFREEFWENVLFKAESHKTRSKVTVCIKHQHFLELILTELSWSMKSKYFLVTSVVQDSNVTQIMTVHGEDIIAGLITSLSTPYLVSAGTDLYLALMASLTLEQWQLWFFEPVVKIISQQDLSLEVENIFNYWMNQTLKKFPSAYADLIENTKDNTFSFVTLCKIGRKECLTELNNLDLSRISNAAEHHSDKIRSQTISLLCTSPKTSFPPSKEEYTIIKGFLKQNINSDNTALRQSLLRSVTDFVLRMRDVLCVTLNKKHDSFKVSPNDQESPQQHCFAFLDWLRSFLLFNLGNKCNYQRKITSLEIYRIVLSYFGEEKEKNDLYKRKSNRNHLNLKKIGNTSWSFKFDSEEDKKVLMNCLFDEDNSIRSSSASILMLYFKITDSYKDEFEQLFKKGIALCSDQMFYRAESGALVTQVLVTLAYKSLSQQFINMINNGSDSFISFLLVSAEEQFSNLREDLLKGASQGSFLYGTLQAIELLITDTSVPELTLSEDQLERLISLVEGVTEYFITILASKSDPLSDYAPSFGEMGMAIAAVVESSSVKNSEFSREEDDTSPELQLTPAQQLVLSCVWLNLKECSKLCSKLISRHLSVKDSQRCVSVVVSVLRRCRHKGAIESAGLALYHITTYLTNSNESKFSDQPEKLLKDFLKILVGTSAATVSRRSAGLALLVHRLITGDSRPNKPLLHLCVSRLLTVAGETEVTEQAALVDLPQSQALHFLRTLVQESSLREHMTQYTLRISLTSLTNLTSPIWTIRNAALQLFGALVPKLVGQKPNQDQGRGNYYLAFEELYAHARPLVEMMLKEFTSAASSDLTTSHSKLMPLLTLVTNLTLGLHSVLRNDMVTIVQKFQICFKILFKSRIFNVRKLSSKAHSLFVTSSRLVDMINKTVVQVMNYIEGKDSVIESENELHGYVLNLTHLFGRFEDDKIGMKILLQKEKEVYSVLEMLARKILAAQCSYFTKSLVFELRFPTPCLETLVLSCNNSIKYSLGFPHFINKKFKSVILMMSEKEIEKVVDFSLLQNSCHDIQYSCLKALRLYARSKKNLEAGICYSLLISLKEYLLFRKHNSITVPLIFEVILSLLEKVKCSGSVICEQFCCPELLTYCLNALSSDETMLPVITVVLPVTSALLSAQNNINLDALLKVLTIIKSKSDPSLVQDIRLGTAKSLNFLSELVKTGAMKENECGELIWRASVELLQDEVTEVRYEASKFVSFVVSETNPLILNPYVSLEYLFCPNHIEKFMTLEKVVSCLQGKLLPKEDTNVHSSGVNNPFNHDEKNTYAEERIISQLSYCSLNNLMLDERVNIQVKQLIRDIKPDSYWHDYY